MARYILALGSSHEHAEDYLGQAINKIAAVRGIAIKGESRIYKNSASFVNYNALFYNGAVAVESALQPFLLYRELYAVENFLGRMRTYVNSRRTIDIDVLMSLDFCYKDSCFNVPHKEAFNRTFFVIPMIEALKSARWPVPIVVHKARAHLGQANMHPHRDTVEGLWSKLYRQR